MAKYKYNPESLQFEVVKANKTRKALRYVTTTLITAIVFCFILILTFLYFFETEEQKRLKYENAALEKQYKQLIKRKAETDKVLRELKNRDQKIYRAVFEADPEPDTSESFDPYKKFEQKNLTALSKSNTETINMLHETLKMQRKVGMDLLKLIKNNEFAQSIPALQPVQNSDLHLTVYGFGQRIDPIYKTPSFHGGIDYACPEGTLVFATGDGIVTNSDYAKRGYGLQIRITHAGGFETVYAHLQESKVSPGKRVKRGELIGLSGNSGKSYAPHLHYEVLLNGKQVNPVTFFIVDLSPEKYREMYSMASRAGVSLD